MSLTRMLTGLEWDLEAAPFLDSQKHLKGGEREASNKGILGRGGGEGGWKMDPRGSGCYTS